MKRSVLWLSIIALVTSSAVVTASAAVKAGGTCTKVKATTVSNGYKYTCVKSGKKLVWSKGVKVVSKATPTPSATPSVTQTSEPAAVSAALSRCEIKETSAVRTLTGKASGFPTLDNEFPHTGTIRMMLLPIDWADLNGDAKFEARVTSQMQTFTDYMKTISGNRLKIEWVFEKNWFRIPGKSGDYYVPYSEAHPEQEDFFLKVLTAIDPKVDFTNIDFVNFVLPAGHNVLKESAQVIHKSAMTQFKVSEGNLSGATALGKFFDEPGVWQNPRTYWSYWAHEIGHALQLAHLGNPRGSYAMAGFDLMGVQDGPTRIMSGWTRFVAGWLSPQQVFCLPSDNLTPTKLTLTPLDNDASGPKIAVVPISNSEAIIIESRRETKFDITDRENPRNGVLVYKYDGRLGHLEDFLTPIAPNSSLEIINWDGVIRYFMMPGDVVQIGGIDVELKASSDKDSVVISKTGSTPRPAITVKPYPLPTTTDYDRQPDIAAGGALRTSETAGTANWNARFFNSYRVYVGYQSDPNAKPLFDSGIVNDYRSPIVVNLTGLKCSRDLVVVTTLFSGLDGKGKSNKFESQALSAVEIKEVDGVTKCLGGFNNNGK
jgi:M6 family metalloprotease-like protein